LDDIFNGFALASLLVFITTYQVYFPTQYEYELYALGLGGYLPTDEKLSYINAVNEVNVVFFWVTIFFVKASFLSLYWVIFGVSKRFRLAWMLVVGYTVVSFLAIFLAFFWSCGTPSQISNLGMIPPSKFLTSLTTDDAKLAACNSISEQLVLNLSVLWCVLNIVGDIASKSKIDSLTATNI
jgi:hypothetical protein